MTLSDYIQEIKTIFIKVLSPHLPLFCALLIIQSIQLCITYCLTGQIGPGLIMGTIAWAYVFSLPLNILRPRILRGTYTGVAITVCSILALVELFCAVKLEEFVGAIHIQTIANTNHRESTEFLTTFVDSKIILYASGIAVLTVASYQLARKFRSNILKLAAGLICIFSVGVTACHNLWIDCGVGRTFGAIGALQEIESIRLKETQPEFNVCETGKHPDIILIIGESFDKYHSNLYGYDKETNPRLAKLVADSSMVHFTAVESPATTTNLSLRQMLSLSESPDDDSWYKQPMLPTALKKGGYHTRWISNQSSTALYDRSFSELAHLCDSVIYTTDMYLDQNEDNPIYDGVLFSPFEKYLSDTQDAELNFCILHLMGSHFRHDLRYPPSFGKFSESDYPDVPKHRRETYSQYDNSILYNDFVVDSLMHLADRHDAIVLYMPDHGFDFYYTRDIASHGSMNNPASVKAGSQIPFMIYFTKPFREKHPEAMELVRNFSKKKFNTKYLMNTIMEIAGYDVCDYDVFEKSLFEGKLKY